MNDIPLLYPFDFQNVKIHQGKVSSYTAHSTCTFLEEMEQETGIKSILFDPVKSPDCSPMDFCVFGLLKQALTREPQLLGVLRIK